MARSPATLPTVRSLAASFLREIGAVAPPLPADICLEARALRIADESLTELLAAVGVSVPVQMKLDAMLEVSGRAVWLRDGLHPHQQKFGTLHEVGHDVLPWQREVLYYCSFFDLPQEIQREWELEANAFAVECLFLSERFMAEALSRPFGLRTAKRLADDYEVSYEAAFRHYVEGQSRVCCMLVSRRVARVSGLVVPGNAAQYEIQYYVNSPNFSGRILPRQRFPCAIVDAVFDRNPLDEVVEHEFPVGIRGGQGGQKVYYAQSFSNSYKLFTILSETPFDA